MPDTNKEVKKITEEVKNLIKRKTAQFLPTGPSEAGYKPGDLKRMFHAGITDQSNSILEQLDRVADEADSALQDRYKKADVYTQAEADGLFRLIEDSYVKDEVYTKVEADNKYRLISDSYTKSEVYTKAETDGKYRLIADSYTKSDVYTKAQADGKYRLIEDSYVKSQLYTKAESDNKYRTKDTSYTILETNVLLAEKETKVAHNASKVRITALENKVGSTPLSTALPTNSLGDSNISDIINTLGSHVDSLQLGFVPRVIRNPINPLRSAEPTNLAYQDTYANLVALSEEGYTPDFSPGQSISLANRLSALVQTVCGRNPNATDAVLCVDIENPDRGRLITYYYWTQGTGDEYPEIADGWYVADTNMSPDNLTSIGAFTKQIAKTPVGYEEDSTGTRVFAVNGSWKKYSAADLHAIYPTLEYLGLLNLWFIIIAPDTDMLNTINNYEPGKSVALVDCAHGMGTDSAISVELLKKVKDVESGSLIQNIQYCKLDQFHVLSNGLVVLYADDPFDGELVVKTGKAYYVSGATEMMRVPIAQVTGLEAVLEAKTNSAEIIGASATETVKSAERATTAETADKYNQNDSTEGSIKSKFDSVDSAISGKQPTGSYATLDGESKVNEVAKSAETANKYNQNDSTEGSIKSKFDSVDSALDGKVALAGAQDISGVKTFTASPIVPSPSGVSAAVNKTYVTAPPDNITMTKAYPQYTLKNTDIEVGTLPTENKYNTFGFLDNSDNPCGHIRYGYTKYGTTELTLVINSYWKPNQRKAGISLIQNKGAASDGTQDTIMLYPIENETHDLGRSTHKWKDIHFSGALKKNGTDINALDETITAIKTFATGATPLITDQPTTDLMAVNKAYCDSRLPVYDKVIRTPAEFNDLITSATWLDAKSVAIVGQFTISKASGIEIPENVKQIHGFNGAKITITDFVYNSSTAKGGLWYATAPTTLDYSIRDLEVSLTGTGIHTPAFYNCIGLYNCKGTGIGGTYGEGFYYCNYITNCVGTGTGEDYGYGFRNCDYITNCVGTGEGGLSGRGFASCNYITNCTGKGVDSGDQNDGFGFYGITRASNCKDGGSSTDMWGGTNKDIDLDTCCKNASNTAANNTTLNT